MWGILGRSLFAFFFATALLRLAGRKSVSQLNYFDFLMANMLGGILGYYVTGGVKGAAILWAPAIITSTGVFSEFVAVKSRSTRKLLEGQPLLLIQNGKVLKTNLGKARYNIDELLAALRKKGIFNLSDVEFALLEYDGQISVLKKSQKRPVSPQDLGLPTRYEGLSSVIINDGQVLDKNLKKNHLNRVWLDNKLKNLGIACKDNVFLATLSTDGTLYVDKKGCIN